MTPSGRPVVWSAGVQYDDVTGTDWHLATRLARVTPVVWVDPPLSVVHAVRTGRSLRGARRADTPVEGLLRVRVLAPPFPHRRGVHRLTRLLVAHAVRRALGRRGRQVAAHVSTSPRRGLGLGLVADRRVYFATDDFVSGASLMRTDTQRTTAQERSRLDEADLVMGVSPEIVDRWDTAGKQTAVLPNGCDVEHYADVDAAAWPADVDLPPPVAGLVGQLSSRIDLDLLEGVADTGASLLLVGPVDPSFEPARFARLTGRGNVAWVGRKAFADLPSYLRVIDVGLTPYVDSDFNRASFPLKTLEYLAAGRAVVSTDLPATERLGTDLVRRATGRAEFVALTVQALAEERDEEVVARRRHFAQQHSWDRRVQQLAGLLGLDAAVTPDVR